MTDFNEVLVKVQQMKNAMSAFNALVDTIEKAAKKGDTTLLKQAITNASSLLEQYSTKLYNSLSGCEGLVNQAA